MIISVCPDCYKKDNELVEGKHLNNVSLGGYGAFYSVYQCPKCKETYKEN